MGHIVGMPGSRVFGGGGPSIPFITAATMGSNRSNFSGNLGFRFTVGAANMTVTDLGRWRFTGNTGTHLVEIWTNDASAVLVASVSVDMSSGTIGEWKYASISPVVLTAGLTYNVVAEEANGGDVWSDDNITGIATESDGTITHSVFESGGGYQNNNAGLRSYVPPNFQYHL